MILQISVSKLSGEETNASAHWVAGANTQLKLVNVGCSRTPYYTNNVQYNNGTENWQTAADSFENCSTILQAKPWGSGVETRLQNRLTVWHGLSYLLGFLRLRALVVVLLDCVVATVDEVGHILDGESEVDYNDVIQLIEGFEDEGKDDVADRIRNSLFWPHLSKVVSVIFWTAWDDRILMKLFNIFHHLYEFFFWLRWSVFKVWEKFI